ncbi:hypothetical protein HPB50_012212 [Hyalomma asiaticum]|uniref:Uncharacterized protein n=1 Tax=Hyalomma asiaticum TaxID=266040 RepID=A0ACB7RZI1_HYAAI|nr:hypothetical protein HPB50_012212 [Hyalomma asiaticum]
MATPLQFVPFTSSMDGTFWSELSRRKLVQYRLGEGPFEIAAAYSCGSAMGLPALANLDIGSFRGASGGLKTPDSCPLQGLLYLPNSLADMKKMDKSELLRKSGELVWAAMRDGRAIKDPSLLNRFLALIYVDLKKYTFCYWFGFPVVRLPGEITLAKPPQRLGELFDESRGEEVQIQRLEELPTLVADGGPFYLAFSDPSTSSSHPGWPLRNLLALVIHHWGSLLSQCNVLCYRREARHGHVDSGHSLVLDVQLCSSVTAGGDGAPTFVGWERNAAGQLGPCSVDLSASLDPARLMENALELNLQLMRFFNLPFVLEYPQQRGLRCLLLGAGTLGCSVARCLVSWGVRNITFVDNAVVSYSNPARQSLYTAQDCQRGGRRKCDAAADALRAVSPAVHARGENLTVPMAGHSVPARSEDYVRADVQRLEALIAEHDAIFLLLDTREARWLPTMIAAAQQQGRHKRGTGLRHAGDGAEKLGCYFCNDVVGPADSTRDRTLDQQCTVTRPGVGAMAGALAAELLGRCPASDDTEAAGENPLGPVPHQIRGFLARHVYMTPTCAAFPMCTACSQPVLKEYSSRGWEFVLQVLNDAAYLERLTGLSRLHEETDLDQVWALSDSEDSAS